MAAPRTVMVVWRPFSDGEKAITTGTDGVFAAYSGWEDGSSVDDGNVVRFMIGDL